MRLNHYPLPSEALPSDPAGVDTDLSVEQPFVPSDLPQLYGYERPLEQATVWDAHAAGVQSAKHLFVGNYLANFVLDLAAHISVQNADSARAAERSSRDIKTGLYRPELMDSTYEQWKRQYSSPHTRKGEAATPLPDSLLIIDIDKFKRYNDAHGHIAGDKALWKVGSNINDNIRSTDMAFRFGGEENVAMLKGASLDDALVIAEKIRLAAEDEGIVTLSIGVTQIDYEQTLASNINTADIALYEAKKTGRNQVVSANVIDPDRFAQLAEELERKPA